MQSLGVNTLKTIRFFIEKESINIFIDHMNFLKESLINPAYRKYIKIYMNPTLCTECFNSKWKTITRLCENCNLKSHGNVIFHHKSAEYHGGHKAYPSGGTFGKFESGQMFLNEKSLVFIKDKKDEAKRIDIIILFSSISLGNYDITAERKGGILGGAAVPIGDSDSYIGGLFSYEGKANRLCVPYIDEYGILQKPVFGISSFGGKEIRKWSHELYKRILEQKRREPFQQPTSSDTSTDDNYGKKESKEDLLKILKVRLAKGAITRDEYLELVKMMD